MRCFLRSAKTDRIFWSNPAAEAHAPERDRNLLECFVNCEGIGRRKLDRNTKQHHLRPRRECLQCREMWTISGPADSARAKPPFTISGVRPAPEPRERRPRPSQHHAYDFSSRIADPSGSLRH